MARIFISYRRQDRPSTTGRIYDQLENAFGRDKVFRDINDIDAGQDFRTKIAQEVDQSDILLVIIGPKWENITDNQGNRRLDNPNDFVRLEIEAGLKDPKKVVIPVLAENAPMPNPDTLPKSLRELCYRNAVNIRQDPDFHSDMHKLISQIRKIGKAGVRTFPRTPILIGAGVLGVTLIAIFAAWPHPQPYPTPAVSLTVPSPLASSTPIQPSETVSPTILPSSTVPPSPSASPTPIRLVQRVKITLVKFTCTWTNDGRADPPGTDNSRPDIDRLFFGYNAYNRKDAKDEPGNQIQLGDYVNIPQFGNATKLYAFYDKGSGWQPSEGEFKDISQSFYVDFDTEHYDFKLARIDLFGYARDYDCCSGNEESHGTKSIYGNDFSGTHVVTIEGGDVTLEAEVKIELID